MPGRILAVRGQAPFVAGPGIEITQNKAIQLFMKQTNNLLKISSNGELYSDLQFQAGMTPSGTFPIGVTVGNVESTDGRDQDGFVLNAKNEDGEYIRRFYGEDGKLYFDGGDGNLTQMATGDDITEALSELTKADIGLGNVDNTSDLDKPISTATQTALNAKQDNMVILSYGNSNWNDFITAYQKNGVIYCRASSNSNPATGAQNRLAFMAYVNDASNPTEVEFQYYRSRSSHGSDANQQDEVYVYKLTSAGTWTVVVRDTASKIATGTGLTKEYTTSGDTSTLTIVNDGVLTVNGENGTVIVNDIKQSATAPANPTAGTAWYDTTNNVLKVYNGTSWDSVATGGSISDTTYGSGWDGQTTIAPSQNAVYDKISTMDTTIGDKANKVSSPTTDDLASLTSGGDIADSGIAKSTVELNTNKETGDVPTDNTTKYPSSHTVKKYVDDQVSAATAGAVSDAAYDPTTWDSVTGIAPSKNAIRDKIVSMDSNISTNTSDISTINGKIPSAASTSNQLADKAYVGDSINSVTAYYITKNAQGDQFATYAELAAATTFYSGGVARVPTRNDYTIVLADENHDNATTRYIYNSGWEYQYTVNETALTQAQLDALNSGITSGKVSTYDGYATTIGSKADDSAVVHKSGAETIVDGLKVFESNDDPTPNTGSVTTSVTLKGKNLKKGGTAGYKYTSIDFKDKDDALVAKFSGLTTPDGWSGFMAGAGSDPTSTSGNLWLIAENSTNNKLLLIPPTTGHNYGAVRYDYYDTNTARLSGDQTIAGKKTFSTSPVVPNKTAAATNSGTEIATEAQVYKKQDTISDLETIRTGAGKGATAVQPGDNLSELAGTSDNITQGTTNLFLTSAERTKLSNTSGTNTGDETKTTIQNKLGAASSSNSGYLTSTNWSTFNGKMPGFSLNISHATSGNPREVKFITIDYGNMTQYGAAYFKLSATSCHPDGGGYNYLVDIILGCTYQGTVTAKILKYVHSSVDQYSPDYAGGGKFFGDVFYVKDTENQKIYFYILGGQYTSSDFTPATKIGSTSLTNVTQHTGTGTYYDGTGEDRVWIEGDSTLYAVKTDIPTKTSQLNNDSGFITSSDLSGYQTTANLKTSLSDNSDTYYPSQKAVKTAVDAKQDKHTTLTLTLSSSGWSSNTQTVTATGVTASNDVIVSPAPSSFSDYGSAGIYCSAQGSNSLTFTCTTTPTSNITVNVIIL